MKRVLVLLFFLCACDSSPELRQIVKEEQTLNDSSETNFISQQALSGILSKEYYLIKARFQEDSRLELFSHFRGFLHEDGLKILFERHSGKLRIKITVQDYPYKTLFEREDYFLNSALGDFSLEVENGTEYGFRVRVWENFINRKGIVKRKTPALRDENLIADSFLKGLVFHGKGQGLKWGLKLYRARLIEGARISPAVVE